MTMMAHGSMWADIVLEKELSILRLELKTTGSELRHWIQLEHICDLRVHPHRTHFLQQGHTYSNEAVPPNNATPFGGHFLQNTAHIEAQVLSLGFLAWC